MLRGTLGLLLPIVVAMACGDDAREDGGQALRCVADDICQLACADDPDCADRSAAEGDDTPGSAGAAAEADADAAPGGAGPTGETECAGDKKLCDGECVSITDPMFGCANPASCRPCLASNASIVCGERGQCVVESCTYPWWDCDGRYADGCEVDLNNDPSDCGACNYSCRVEEPEVATHAELTCGRGVCVIRLCDRGYGDCDDDRTNGCEVDLSSSREHCGACDSPCAETEDCVDGSCLAD